MRRDCGNYDDYPISEEPQASRDSSRRHVYLSDTLGAYQGFWLRQSNYWYDVLGRFVCGEYRVEDSSADLARYWDGWMADYERCLQFPLRKAQAGQVPTVVFVLDELAQGSPAKEVPINFGVGRVRPALVASPLQPAAAAGGALLRAELDSRGYFAKISLLDAGSIPREEVHLVSIVHTEASRLPVAVVHIVRRATTQPVPVVDLKAAPPAEAPR